MKSFSTSNATSITTNSVKLRSKFIKAFASPSIQEAILRKCTELNQLPAYEVFRILMQTLKSHSELTRFTGLQSETLSNEQCVTIWNELRSQYNIANHVFPNAEVFTNCCKPYMELFVFLSEDNAFNIFKLLATYYYSTESDKQNRVLYLLSSEKEAEIIGGLHEIGFSYEMANKFLPFASSIADLATALQKNNCYMYATDFLKCINTSDMTLETTVSDVHPSEQTFAKSNKNTLKSTSSNKTETKSTLFSMDKISVLIKNYELFADVLDCFKELREIGFEPDYVLEHENDFQQFVKSIDNLIVRENQG